MPFGFINNRMRYFICFSILTFSINCQIWGEADPFNKSKALEKYTQCYKSYVTLNNKFISNKDIALKSNESTVNKLSEIVTQFDSCLFYLNIKDQNPELDSKITLSPIETFRLDGLLMPNTQSENLKLWDYGKWAKSVLRIINTDILSIRKNILETDKQFIDAIKLANGKTNEVPIKPLTIPKELIQLLNKYDYNSLPLTLLTYKKEKLDLLIQSKDPLNAVDKVNFSATEKRQLYFYEMYNRAVKLDTLLTRLKSFQLYKEYPKYEEYITNFYRDNEGLSDYFLGESNLVRSKTSEFLLKFRTIAFNSIQEFYSTKAITTTSEGVALPLYIGTIGNTQTQAIQRDSKGNIYATGIQDNIPFVAKINSDNSFAWINKLTAYTGNEKIISAIAAYEHGCVLSIYKASSSNVIVRFSENGEQVSTKTITEPQAARFISFDELSDQYIIAYKGINLIPETSKSELNLVVSYNKDGTEAWRKTISFTGALNNFIRISEGYLWVANYTSLTLGEKTFASLAGIAPEKTNIFILKFGTDGNIKKQLNLSFVKPIFSLGTDLITNNNIHIMGYVAENTASNRTKKFTPGDDILHLRLNANLQVLYNNLLE
jgi:hypothetical protein